MSFVRPYTDWASDREGVEQTLERAGLTGPVPHPAYSPDWTRQSGGERCICGGIKHWHATPEGGGCDDCPCTEFRPATPDE